jgi:hypothetical protein
VRAIIADLPDEVKFVYIEGRTIKANEIPLLKNLWHDTEKMIVACIPVASFHSNNFTAAGERCLRRGPCRDVISRAS